MGDAANKTVETDADVDGFVASVADPAQRDDARVLIDMMGRLSGDPAKMWGPAIIGFGSVHYRYDSGREGDMPRIGFSPRKGKTTLYPATDFPGFDGIMARLGKRTMSKACVYVKRLSDINLGVLEELVVASLAETDRRYPPA